MIRSICSGLLLIFALFFINNANATTYSVECDQSGCTPNITSSVVVGDIINFKNYNGADVTYVRFDYPSNFSCTSYTELSNTSGYNLTFYNCTAISTGTANFSGVIADSTDNWLFIFSEPLTVAAAPTASATTTAWSAPREVVHVLG